MCARVCVCVSVFRSYGKGICNWAGSRILEGGAVSGVRYRLDTSDAQVYFGCGIRMSGSEETHCDMGQKVKKCHVLEACCRFPLSHSYLTSHHSSALGLHVWIARHVSHAYLNDTPLSSITRQIHVVVEGVPDAAPPASPSSGQGSSESQGQAARGSRIYSGALR